MSITNKQMMELAEKGTSSDFYDVQQFDAFSARYAPWAARLLETDVLPVMRSYLTEALARGHQDTARWVSWVIATIEAGAEEE